MHNHLPEASQHEVTNETTYRVYEGKTRATNGQTATGTEEQPCSKGTTKRDHLDVTRLEILFVSLRFFRSNFVHAFTIYRLVYKVN